MEYAEVIEYTEVIEYVNVMEYKEVMERKKVMEYTEFKNFQSSLSYTESPKDERAHIGLVLLSTDHSLEADWSKLLQGNALTFTSRIEFSSDLSVENLLNLNRLISNGGKLIATGLKMDVMAFACTSASIMIGCDKIKELLNEGRDPTPATNPWLAAKKAFNHLNAKKIAIYSPYQTEIDYRLYKNLISEGFEVIAFGSLGIKYDIDIDIPKISKQSIIDGLEKMLLNKKADAIFMPCTNLRVIDHINEIEKHFGIPVVTSNQALLWHALKLAKKEIKLPGYGTLLMGL